MQSYFVSWIVVLGMATGVAGCASIKQSGGTMIVDQSNHHRLNSSLAIIATWDGPMLVEPSAYSPTDSVKRAIIDVHSILGNESLKQPGWFEERRQQIEQVIRDRVNFGQMAQRSLGVPWTTLSDKERQEFVNLFVQLIRDTVANKIDQYYGEQIFYLIEQREGGFAQVKTHLIGPKVDTSLDFRLENQSGKWLVYDVVIDGISSVRNYRTQFSQIIRDNTYARLVEKMKQRVHTVKWFEKTAPAAVALLSTDTSERP
ncbi:MAG: ABC transporter substrate-binding protein [Nitrospirae bacterium]|nr:ABC transporter substrate-binding protein [Nitrospirota bacterium]